MYRNKFDIKPFSRELSFIRPLMFLACFLLVLSSSWIFLVSAQDDAAATDRLQSDGFRTGERLTYNVSFGRFNSAAYAEIFVASRGKLEGKDTVELRSRIKTNEFVSAVFYLIDVSRTTFAAPENGLPLYIRKTSNETGLPKESVENYLNAPTINYDLLTLIYQARRVGGIGTFSLFEDEKNYAVTMQNTVSEQVMTDAGEFDTSISAVTSEYLTDRGIANLRINFSQDEARIPVLIRFKTEKGEFRADLSSIQFIGVETTTVPVQTPTPTPVPTPAPSPFRTPRAYVENQPLPSELPFVLGETLEYKITASGQPFGQVTLQAKQRTQFKGEDSLLLTARVTGIDQENQVFKLNDEILAQVSPDSLAPQLIELNFGGSLNQYNQTVQFDQRAGTAIFNGRIFPDVPVGTHSLLSLAYAIRSFNLKPSLDLTNPVNDTRVAVFWDDKAHVFILRPKNREIILFQNRRISAQQISITTGIPVFDRLNLRLWISNDEKRTPLRLTAGVYQADLISEKIITPPRSPQVP